MFTAVSDDNRTVDGKGGADVITALNGAGGGSNAIDGDAGTDTLLANANTTTIGLSSLAGNQAFTFIGSDEFTAVGQVRVGLIGGHVAVQANTTGSIGAELNIVLDSNPVLTIGDFIL